MCLPWGLLASCFRPSHWGWGWGGHPNHSHGFDYQQYVNSVLNFETFQSLLYISLEYDLPIHRCVKLHISLPNNITLVGPSLLLLRDYHNGFLTALLATCFQHDPLSTASQIPVRMILVNFRFDLAIHLSTVCQWLPTALRIKPKHPSTAYSKALLKLATASLVSPLLHNSFFFFFYHISVVLFPYMLLQNNMLLCFFCLKTFSLEYVSVCLSLIMPHLTLTHPSSLTSNIIFTGLPSLISHYNFQWYS